MFRDSMRFFTNEEQYKKWMPKIQNFDISGCYAQTEIGHGSNISGLETTAIFDKDTDTFVINTPTETATKWWPGELGRYANYAVLFANLIIDGNSYGIMPFIVQLRDLNTHKHVAGVKTGDMGPKFGYFSKDNGWATFKNVRVPRDQLLQKFVQVDRDGTFSVSGDIRALYASMLITRTQMVKAASLTTNMGLTIALRYSTVRRQFKNISGQKEEVQLIDYQT